MASSVFDCCPTIDAGRPGHILLLLFFVGLHIAMMVRGIQSSLPWTPGLGAYEQLIKEVPSQLPILLWLIKASYVFPALFTCLIAVSFFAICSENGRLLRLMASLQFALVATHFVCGAATGAFYTEVLRPKLDAKEVVIEAAARHPASFHTAEKWSRTSGKTHVTYYFRKKVYVSDTDWHLEFECNKRELTHFDWDPKYNTEEGSSRAQFQPDHIRNCSDITPWVGIVRIAFDVFRIPICTCTGLVVAILTQHQVLFDVRPSERVGCENWKCCSPLCLTSWCVFFTITFKVPTGDDDDSDDDEDDRVNEPNRAEENGRYYFEYERAQVSSV